MDKAELVKLIITNKSPDEVVLQTANGTPITWKDIVNVLYG